MQPFAQHMPWCQFTDSRKQHKRPFHDVFHEAFASLTAAHLNFFPDNVLVSDDVLAQLLRHS